MYSNREEDLPYHRHHRLRHQEVGQQTRRHQRLDKLEQNSRQTPANQGEMSLSSGYLKEFGKKSVSSTGRHFYFLTFRQFVANLYPPGIPFQGSALRLGRIPVLGKC